MTLPDFETIVLSAELPADRSRLKEIITEAANRDYLCANFARLAPVAWSSLLDLEPSLAALMSDILERGRPVQPSDRDLLKTLVASWAERHKLSAPWLMQVARLTLIARWVLQQEQALEGSPLDTLDWTIRVTITNDPSVKPWLISFTRGEYRQSLHASLTIPQQELTWFPLDESKADFLREAVKGFTRSFNQAYANTHLPNGPITADTEAIDLFLRTRTGGESKRSIRGEKGRGGVLYHVDKIADLLGFPRDVDYPLSKDAE